MKAELRDYQRSGGLACVMLVDRGCTMKYGLRMSMIYWRCRCERVATGFLRIQSLACSPFWRWNWLLRLASNRSTLQCCRYREEGYQHHFDKMILCSQATWDRSIYVSFAIIKSRFNKQVCGKTSRSTGLLPPFQGQGAWSRYLYSPVSFAQGLRKCLPIQLGRRMLLLGKSDMPDCSYYYKTDSILPFRIQGIWPIFLQAVVRHVLFECKHFLKPESGPLKQYDELGIP